jgi:hypothetical protein
MTYDLRDTDLLDIQTAIQAVIEAQPAQPVTMRIPVWFYGRIVAWYTIEITRKPEPI